jgi:hypothetical protein
VAGWSRVAKILSIGSGDGVAEHAFRLVVGNRLWSRVDPEAMFG